jgi:titin
VAISAGASGNRIGTDGRSADDVGERNVIAGSGNDGIDIYGIGTDANIVAGNFIGTDFVGTSPLGIAGYGAYLAEGASSNWIGVHPSGGGAIQDEGNVISGSGKQQVQISGTSSSNVVAGNKIGTDVTGTVALGNWSGGVLVDTGCIGNTIGGTAPGAGNVILGIGNDGVQISGSSSFNVVVGNKIGTDVTGTVSLSNSGNGIEVDAGCVGNTIGGTALGAGNLIATNGTYFVWITGDGATDNLVQGNAFGTALTGSYAPRISSRAFSSTRAPRTIRLAA